MNSQKRNVLLVKFSQLPITAKGIATLCTTLAVLFFSVRDASIKFLSGNYALHQIVLVRSLIGLLVLSTIFIPFNGTFHVLKTRRLGMHILKGSLCTWLIMLCDKLLVQLRLHKISMLWNSVILQLVALSLNTP